MRKVGDRAAERRVRALLRHCCHGHCDPTGGHACDRPPPLDLEPVTDPGNLEASGPLRREVLARLERSSGARVTRDNGVRLLLDGVQSYTAMLDLVESAREEVLFENFIMRADAVGLAFADQLRRRGADGLRVQVLHDPLGSRLSTLALALRFRASGVEVRLYNPPRPSRAFFRRGRDHRKLVVQDRARLVTGGMCLADLWAGNCVSRCTWRDSAVLVEGEAAPEAAREFDDLWRYGMPLSPRRRPRAGRAAPPPARAPAAGEVPVRVLADSPRRRCVEAVLVEVLAAADEEILVTNSYFVPTPPVAAALTAAARRGVAVEMILPRASDHPLLDLASEHLLGELLRAGVVVWRWTGPMIHAKAMVVDRRWSLVGSSNLDSFSLRRNAEINVEIHGSAVGQQMVRVFQHDRLQAEPFSLADWRLRRPMRRRLGRLLAPAGAWM